MENNKAKNDNTPSQNENYIQEYNEIMKSYIVYGSKFEWTKTGDSFQKFSTYENYTPVKTSCNTTLISNL